MEMQEHILALIDHAFHAQREFASELSPADQERQGEADHWAPKDILAHNAAWIAHHARNIQTVREGGEPQRAGETDDANLEFFQAHRQATWSEVMDMMDRARAALWAQVEALEEADLHRENFFPWLDNRPLWQSTVGTAFTHVIMHLADAYRELGLTDRAFNLQQALGERLLMLDSSADWVGVVRYNLACSYALGGERRRALQELGVALDLRPDLRDWSRQDPDFVSLRDDPQYRDLTRKRNGSS